MPQGSLTRAGGGHSKYAKDTQVDDIDANAGSLPPIMGVMGNNKMQQSYKYQTLDKKNGAKRKKRLRTFESKHMYNIPAYAQGAAGAKKLHGLRDFSASFIPQQIIESLQFLISSQGNSPACAGRGFFSSTTAS